jgi:type VI secretion system protein ImpM
MAFWRKRQPLAPVVSCFGKLPATGDFVRYQAGGPEYQAFDAWLESSIAHAKHSLGQSFDSLYEPTLGLFIYRGDDAQDPDRGMIGAWAASGDSAGRRFPIMVTSSYDYDQLLGVGPALPLAVWPFLTNAYSLVSNGRSLRIEEFTMRVQQMRPCALDNAEQVATPYTSWLRYQSMRAFWDTTFGSIAVRHHVVYSVLATVEIFRGQERPATQLALRFPIGMGDAYAVAVWMDLTLRLAGLQRTVLNVFWTPQHDLLIHLGSPHATTFREIIANSGDAEHVTDLLQQKAMDPQTARQHLGSLAELVDDPDMSIHAFLAGLSSAR